MTPVELLLSKIPRAIRALNGSGWSAHCPAHEDRNPSLSVSESNDGTALLKCHAGCTTEAVLAAIGLGIRDLFPERDDPKPTLNGKAKPSPRTFATANDAVAELERKQGKRSDLWTYHNARGEPVGVVVRWDRPDGKAIRPVSRNGEGWRIAAMPEPRPLYGLPSLAKASRVVVVEGEKAADAARSIGFTATTSAGGSGAAIKADWRPLEGKEVWILPDNDAPGRKYADTVAGILAKLTPASIVRLVELPDLPEHGDLVQWIEAHGDAAEPDELRKELEALACAVESERSHDDSEDFLPFPTEALPEPVRGFVVNASKAILCDSSYLALPLLTAIASAIGTTRRLELKRGWSAPPIIWGAIVGESGTSKTPAFMKVMRPIRERQRKALERHAEAMKHYANELSHWEKAYAAWKRSKDTAEEPPEKPVPPPCERYIVSDTTVEALAPILLANPRGLLLARDELTGWIGSFDRYAGKGKAGADSANWLSMFNAESVIVDRKTGIPPTIYIPQAAMCVCGGIQPGILKRALGDEHRESGLAARVLMTFPVRKAKQWTEADIDPKAEAELVRLVDRLFDLQPTTDEDGEARPVLVRLHSDAKKAWIEYYNAHGIEQADMAGELAAAWSKLEEYPARLALVVHFIRWAAGEISDERQLDVISMKAGITMVTWFKREARRIYAMLAETNDDERIRRLVEWIRRKGGTASARETQQGCRWLKEPGVAEEALAELAKAGRGVWQDSQASPRGGRPARVFVLNARPAVHETPTKPEAKQSSVDVDSVDADEQQWRDGRLFPDQHGLPD